MQTDATESADATDTVALRVTRRAHLVPEVARQAFADLGWLGRPVDAELAEGWRQIAADLELPVRDGSGPAVRKAALIDIGPVREMGDGLDIPIAWRSASLTPLFPVFAGQLEITRSGLVLAGRYAPPLGRVGLLIDQSLMHFVATRTGQAFLASVARECRGRSVDT
ncbi:MAG: hypothetical protein WEC14_03550 [Chloroflexota bacterium]